MTHTETRIQHYIAPGRRAHLVGIGGVSMSPLAEVLHKAGMVITGSDMRNSATVEHLRALGPVLYLRVPLPELERRVNNITTRGIAMAPGQTLGDVYAQRAPLYEQYAGAVVEVAPRAALENTVAAVCVRLNELDLTDIP